MQGGEPAKLRASQCKLLDRSLRHQAALLHDQYLIESVEEAQAVNRGDHASLGEGGEQASIDACLGRRIETGGRLVHQDDIAPAGRQNSARQGDTAALAAGPIRRSLGHRGREPEGRGLHEVVAQAVSSASE